MNPKLKQCPQCHTMKLFSTDICYRCLDTNEARRVAKLEVDQKITELLREFANTPLDKRGTGWDWLLRVRKEIV